MLKRSKIFGLVQTTLQNKRDYQADATIEKLLHAQVGRPELQNTSMDADGGSVSSDFISSD